MSLTIKSDFMVTYMSSKDPKGLKKRLRELKRTGFDVTVTSEGLGELKIVASREPEENKGKERKEDDYER